MQRLTGGSEGGVGGVEIGHNTGPPTNWLFMRDRDELSACEQKALDSMLNIGDEIVQTYALARDFIQMVRERQVQALNPLARSSDHCRYP